MGRELGALHDDGGVDVGDRKSPIGERGDDGAQQQHRVGVAVLLVGVGKVLADVAHRGGAEQRVDDRVGEHVGVGVAVEAELVRDGDPAEDERAPGHEPVRVPADARDARHPIGSRRRSRRVEDRQLAHPELAEELERLVVVAAEVLGAVRVAGQSDRVAGIDHHLQERPRRVQLADRLAQPGGGDLDRDARRGDGLHGDGVEGAQVAFWPWAPGGTPVLDEIGVGQDVEHPARRGLPQPLEVRAPHLLRRARRRPDVVAVVVERAVADEVDRADDVVEVAATQQLGHALLAPGDEIGLDPELEVGLLAHEGAVGVEVVARGVAPQLVLPHLERLGEAVDVLGHPQLLDAALRRARPVALGVLGRQVALGRRGLDVVGAQVDVVVGQHAAPILAGRPRRLALRRHRTEQAVQRLHLRDVGHAQHAIAGLQRRCPRARAARARRG